MVVKGLGRYQLSLIKSMSIKYLGKRKIIDSQWTGQDSEGMKTKVYYLLLYSITLRRVLLSIPLYGHD